MVKNLFLMSLIEIADSSFARNLKNKNSIMGYCFFLNGAIVTEFSKK